MRIGVLTNRRAGRKESRIARVVEEVRRHPHLVHRETRSHRGVPAALDDFAAAGVEILVINGGDGSVQHALTGILGDPRRRWRPRVAPLRSGRTNMAALDIGAGRDPARSVRRLVEAERAGALASRTVERAVMRVDPGEGAPRYGLFLGLGMLHRAIRLTHRTFPEGRAQGVFGGAVMLATLVTRAAAGRRAGVLGPDKMQIALNGEPLAPEQFLLVMATTLDRLFLRVRPFWGREDRGVAPVRVTAIASGAHRLAAAAPGLLAGRPPRHAVPGAGYTSRNVAETAFRLDAGLALDGELLEPRPDRTVRVRADDRLRFVGV